MIQASSLDDAVGDLANRLGLTALSGLTGVDKATLCRFRSGEGAMTIAGIERLLEAGDLVVIPRERYRAILSAILLFADMVRLSK